MKTATYQGVTHTFPDDATDSEISDAMNQFHPVASDQDIEAARPKNIGEIAWNGLKNIAAGAVKAPTDIMLSGAALLGKLRDKLGQSGSEQDALQQKNKIDSAIDAKMGTGGPGSEIPQMVGNVVPQMLVPWEKAIPVVKAIGEAASLPPWLTSLGSKAAVNSGVGAVSGEESGHPFLGAATGLVGTVAGEGLKDVGGQVIKSYLKAGHKGAAEGIDIPWFINNNMGGSAETMTQNAENALSVLRQKQSQIIAANKDKLVPVFDKLGDVQNEFSSSAGIAKNFGSENAGQSQIDDYLNSLVKIADDDGNVPLEQAWKIKQKAANDATALYKAARVDGDTKKMVAQAASASFASKLGDALGEAAPGLNDLNPEFSKLIPVAKALARRNVIAGQHNPIGLDELAALDAGTNFMVHGNWEGGLIPIIQRLSKMPAAGQKARQLGGLMQSPSANILPPYLMGNVINAVQPQGQGVAP